MSSLSGVPISSRVAGGISLFFALVWARVLGPLSAQQSAANARYVIRFILFLRLHSTLPLTSLPQIHQASRSCQTTAATDHRGVAERSTPCRVRFEPSWFRGPPARWVRNKHPPTYRG